VQLHLSSGGLLSWKADYQRLGLPEAKDFSLLSTINNETALVHHNLPEQDLFLEEFRFKTQANQNVKDVINNIIKLVNNDIKANLIKQLVIINDDMFAHLCRYATPVYAHIAIDNETKVTKPGALWYEETLPPNTLLYTSLIAQNSRKPKDKNDKKLDANDWDVDQTAKSSWINKFAGNRCGIYKNLNQHALNLLN